MTQTLARLDLTPNPSPEESGHGALTHKGFYYIQLILVGQ